MPSWCHISQGDGTSSSKRFRENQCNVSTLVLVSGRGLSPRNCRALRELIRSLREIMR